jgi:hypothetical protein
MPHAYIYPALESSAEPPAVLSVYFEYESAVLAAYAVVSQFFSLFTVHIDLENRQLAVFLLLLTLK